MTTKLIIKVVDQQTRANWTKLDDVRHAGFKDSEILEMVQRYQDAQVHAVNYRERAKIKTQMMKDRLAELESEAKARLIAAANEAQA